jgi:hypothetical protein
MATRHAAAVETRKPTIPQREKPSIGSLLERYECGPVPFFG